MTQYLGRVDALLSQVAKEKLIAALQFPPKLATDRKARDTFRDNKQPKDFAIYMTNEKKPYDLSVTGKKNNHEIIQFSVTVQDKGFVVAENERPSGFGSGSTYKPFDSAESFENALFDFFGTSSNKSNYCSL